MVSERKLQKRIQKIRDAPNAVHWEDLVWVLDKIGYDIRTGGKHRVVAHYPGQDNLEQTIAAKNPLPQYPYVKRALDYIDEILEEGE